MIYFVLFFKAICFCNVANKIEFKCQFESQFVSISVAEMCLQNPKWQNPSKMMELNMALMSELKQLRLS